MISLFVHHLVEEEKIRRGCNLNDQALNLLYRDYQFECHKLQDHWRFTLSLTSGSRGISRGARKLTRIPTITENKKEEEEKKTSSKKLYLSVAS
jgi:hypothetical protein